MHAHVSEILYSEEQLKQRVRELGERITADYQGKEPLFISILKGSFIFMSDLVREVDLHLTVDFMVVSSYGSGTKTSGTVKIVKDLDIDIEGRDIIIIEDILDSGLTLSYLKGLLEARNPASVRICTLLDKPERRTADIKADYVGYSIPDNFIVGYGLDYNEQYRSLPYIGVLKPEIYN